MRSSTNTLVIHLQHIQSQSPVRITQILLSAPLEIAIGTGTRPLLSTLR